MPKSTLINYMNSFKAEHMGGAGDKTPVVDWEINCVKEG